MTEHIIVADEDSTRTITMRRPEKKNTLTQDMMLAAGKHPIAGTLNPHQPKRTIASSQVAHWVASN